jgi:hypothetical protein
MFEKSNGSIKVVIPNTDVVAKAMLKRFTAAENRRILREVVVCHGSGEIDALLRPEPKPDPQELQLAKLHRKNPLAGAPAPGSDKSPNHL